MNALVPPAKTTPTRQLPKSMDLLRWCDGDAAETSGSTIGRAKGSASCKSTELVDSTKISECPVLPLSCLGIWASRQRVRCFPYLSERSPSHTDFRIIRAPDAALIYGPPSQASLPKTQSKLNLASSIFYFWVWLCLLQSHRVGTSNWLMGPANRSVLHDPHSVSGRLTAPRWSVHEARV